MNRDEVLRMMLSKNITPAEFEFDKLTAPPIEYFLSPQDLSRLIYLANSPRFSAKIDYKYEEIDKIMQARGFKLLGRGTNRVVYRYLENNTICMKIAVDHIGASDNPHEFINQEYLKPFVSKVFHVDPTGTVAVCERVHGIQTREEFSQYAPGIFDLIFKWFTGKYVVNDIGSKFFMNWGIRYSTGIPVLLDYPYFYELDIRKAKCMSILDDNTICCGDIDYDDGYNILQCTKCGRKYRALELAKDVESGAVRIIGKGDLHRMKIKLMRNGKLHKEIQVNPETKKIDVDYAMQQANAKVLVKKVLDEQREAQKNAPAQEEEKSKVVAPKVKVKNTTGRVSIVINKSEMNEEPKKYKTEGSFIPKKGTAKVNKKTTKKNVVKKKISVNLNGNKRYETSNEPFPQVKVKVAGKAVKESDLENKVEEPKVDLKDTENTTSTVEATEVETDTKIEDVVIVNAPVIEAETINANGTAISQEALDKAVEEESAQRDIITEEETSVEEPQTENEDTAEDDGNLNASIANAISEAISEATDSVIDAIDASENPDPDLEEVMKAEEEIRKERDHKKKFKKSSKKYDPTFYKK